MKPRRPIVAGGYVERGKVVWDAPRLVKAALTSWSGRVTVTITPEVETRRAQQNRYYWGVVLKMIAEESGHEPAQIHALMKQMFNAETLDLLNPQTGEIEETTIAKTTTTLTVQDFSDYVERIKVWAAEFFGLVIPEPSES